MVPASGLPAVPPEGPLEEPVMACSCPSWPAPAPVSSSFTWTATSYRRRAKNPPTPPTRRSCAWTISASAPCSARTLASSSSMLEPSSSKRRATAHHPRRLDRQRWVDLVVREHRQARRVRCQQPPQRRPQARGADQNGCVALPLGGDEVLQGRVDHALHDGRRQGEDGAELAGPHGLQHVLLQHRLERDG